jgi:hypothetical protein
MDSVRCLCKRSVKVIRTYINKIKSLTEINKLQTYINRTIQIVRKAIKIKIYQDNCLESPLSLEVSLSHLKYYRLKIKQIKKSLIKSGEGVSTCVKRQVCSVKWEDIESSFNNRIRTGFISTVNIKDPLIFLKKSYTFFLIKIKKILQESMIKCNVILSANFIKLQTGEVDLKSFSTKNSPLDSTTDLKRWYQNNVTDKLMTKLDDLLKKIQDGLCMNSWV